MDQMTVMTIRMKKNADQFRVPTISTNAKTQNASSKPTFAMEKMIAVTIQMNRTNTLARHHHSDAPSVNGNAPESPLVVST